MKISFIHFPISKLNWNKIKKKYNPNQKNTVSNIFWLGSIQCFHFYFILFHIFFIYRLSEKENWIGLVWIWYDVGKKYIKTKKKMKRINRKWIQRMRERERGGAEERWNGRQWRYPTKMRMKTDNSNWLIARQIHFSCFCFLLLLIHSFFFLIPHLPHPILDIFLLLLLPFFTTIGHQWISFYHPLFPIHIYHAPYFHQKNGIQTKQWKKK